MQEVSIYQVDAFTSRAFGGNPAAICPVPAFLDPSVMQSIARENNLSETAFIVPREDRAEADYDLRWFTPSLEVDLCGHATLASGLVVIRHLEPALETVRFATRSGILQVTKRADGKLALEMPTLMPTPVTAPDGLAEAMGAIPEAVLHRGRDYLLIYREPQIIQRLHPDMRALQAYAPYGFIATAPGTDGVDFVSRCFFPNHGIPEDPVTGSAHCLSGPYWAERFGRSELHALQISARGGELWITVKGDRIELAGSAVEVMRGALYLSH
ncbi:PhzF family phenazine biosynthesis protein [Gimibacter soli]|uniref:PhzF family phenazine biosynthesis protein n=1 Tax=Gimibacter soli TaxID=3024400 RepID=A0AAE9XVC2_9PROT|nr:PhzF family phenazine biosynthesis protein [Gimibacter soli]WCL55520.1 PhzF family phenazine biosynthesis protein [Gimibacter soli]